MIELPFTIDQFLQVFEVYNRAIWPTQIVAYLLGAVVLWLVKKTRSISRNIYKPNNWFILDLDGNNLSHHFFCRGKSCSLYLWSSFYPAGCGIFGD